MIENIFEFPSKPKDIKLLLVEDNPADAKLIQIMLAKGIEENFVIEWVPNLSQGLQRLSQGEIDLVLLDLGLPDSQGLDTFIQAYAHASELPFVLLTGLDDETIAFTALRKGAQDYLLKDEITPNLLRRAIRYATERKQAEIALKAEREKLFSVLENLPAFVYLRGADFKISFANRRFLEVFGEPGDRPCYEVLRRKSEPCEDCQLFEILKTKVTYQFEWTTAINNRTYEVYNYPFHSGDDWTVLTMGLDITEHRQAEEAVRESNDRLRALIQTSPAAIVALDVDGKVTLWNPAAKQIFGWSEEEALGQNYSNLVIPKQHPGDFEILFRRVLQGESLTALEFLRQRKDGDQIYVNSSAAPLHDARGNVTGVMGVMQDITEHKRAEVALRDSEERFRLAIQATNDAIWDLNLTAGTVHWNETYATAFGRPQETKNSWQWWIDHIHPDDRERTVSGLRGAIDGRENTWTCEYRFLRVDGVWADIYDRAYIARDDSGKAWRVIGAMQDVTERKRAEAALQESEKRFKQLVEYSPFPLSLVNANNDIEYLNPKFLQTIGYNLEDLPNLRVWTNLAYPDRRYRKKVIEIWGSVLKRATQEGKEIEPVEFQVTCKDGTVRIMEILGAPISQGKHFVVFKDLTEHKRAEEKLRVSEQNLRYLTSQLFTAQERERKRISSELHDELGQSLLTLKLLARSIENGKSLKHIKDTCQQMRSYLDEVVENVRLLSMELSPRNLENFGLFTALKRLTNDFAKHYQIEQFHIEIDEINDLFSMEAQLNLYRVVQECLTNIGKHAQATRLSVIVKRQGESLTFQVEDNGKGFDVARVLHDKNAHQGIGLASMEERVRMLGGSLEIRSQEGQGTRITFTIPIASDTQQDN